MSKNTYYKSQIVPGNRGTTVYWVEDDNGRAKDTARERIPKDAKILDADDAMLAEMGESKMTYTEGFNAGIEEAAKAIELVNHPVLANIVRALKRPEPVEEE